MENKINIFWFRRDLRLSDNAGLYYALKSGCPVLPVFIFDTDILNDLKDKRDKRVTFIYDALKNMQAQLLKTGSTLKIFHGTPVESFKKLSETYDIEKVYTNHDYEPYAIKRDKEVAALLKTQGIEFHSYKDHVIFEKNEIAKEDGTPYTIYTPYSKKWKTLLNDFYLSSYPVEKYFHAFIKSEAHHLPSLNAIGFEEAAYQAAAPLLDKTIAMEYDKLRDMPAINGTTRLSVHLRFGTISVRQMAAQTKQLNETLLNEIIWREFYSQALYHFPYIINHCFKREFDDLRWRNDKSEFERWRNGETGYPIVDAGMRELNETGYMHNRVRMITASFLCKDLLIDWRWGEAYFAEKLLDYDLASNNGNWQWSAGTGCDAAPYFRIFNPALQMKKFDPHYEYIKKWVPEFGTADYPEPIVDHNIAKQRCLETYGKVAKSKQL